MQAAIAAAGMEGSKAMQDREQRSGKTRAAGAAVENTSPFATVGIGGHSL
jgi:hypothetical protein